MKIIRPDILIISNKLDFSTDYVVFHLKRLGMDYLRINRDDLPYSKICFSPLSRKINGVIKNVSFEIGPEKLKSIYYRAPTFLRAVFDNETTLENQLKKTQWAAFVRSLIIFENVKWINNPISTFRAEIKSYQLLKAHECGFQIPETLIANYCETSHLSEQNEFIAVKSIDTAYLNLNDKDGFVYTSIYKKEELDESVLNTAPFFVQEGLVPKIDLRITVVGKMIYAVKIIGENEIDGDWRLLKDKLRYVPFELPSEIKLKCTALMSSLGLEFGAIDMIIYKDRYYFIEINPTGEWAWLMANSKLDIDLEIAKLLSDISNE